MKKYLLYLLIVPIGLLACEKAKEPGIMPISKPLQPNISGLSGSYVLYMKIDTTYDYYSAAQFNLDITHQTLTGDTIYLKAGTANMVIQPNPIADYDPKLALADTLIFLKDNRGTETGLLGSGDFEYNLATKSFAQLSIPGISAKIFVIDNSTVEIDTKTIDPDGNVLTDANGRYFKKL